MQEGIPHQGEIAREQAVQKQQARDVRHGLKNRRLHTQPSPDGQQAQALIEDQLEEQRHPEGRQRDRADGEEAADMVQELILFLGRIDSQRDPDQHRQQERQQHQLQGCRNVALQLCGHRLVGAQALAQIAVQQVAQIDHILLRKGFVQAELNARGFQLLRGRALSRPLHFGVGGNHPRDEERYRHHTDQHDNTAEDTLEDVFQHRLFRLSLNTPKWRPCQIQTEAAISVRFSE